MARKWIGLLAALLLLFGIAEGTQRKQKSDDKQAVSKESKQSTGKVDINTASESDLVAVKGIGPATAKKIIAARPYSSIDDLTKAGLTAGRIDSLRSSLSVSKTTAVSSPSPTTAKSSTTTAPTTTSSDANKKPSLWDRLKGKKSADTGTGGKTTNSSSSSTSTNASASASDQTSASTAAAPGGGNGKVWVNKETKVFHREGDRWYGKTKNGEYMTEQEALKAGNRPVKEHKK